MTTAVPGTDRAPDIVGEVVGLRAWVVEGLERAGPPRLVSLFHSTTWPRDTWMLAACDLCADEDIPNPRCSCGIHAARDRPHLRDLGYAHTSRDVVAIGEVALAGKVIVGANGWRAEKARVARLWLPYQHWRVLRPLQNAYGVPVALTNVREGGS